MSLPVHQVTSIDFLTDNDGCKANWLYEFPDESIIKHCWYDVNNACFRITIHDGKAFVLVKLPDGLTSWKNFDVNQHGNDLKPLQKAMVWRIALHGIGESSLPSLDKPDMLPFNEIVNLAYKRAIDRGLHRYASIYNIDTYNKDIDDLRDILNGALPSPPDLSQ